MAASIAIVALTGKHTIDINGTPTRTEWFVLTVVLLGVPVAGLIGWLVSRLAVVNRNIVSGASVAIALAGGVFGGPSPRIVANIVVETAIMAAIMLCTATGVGSILGWAVRTAVGNLALIGSMFVRALPVVLLTVLVFFNAAVWLMASLVSRPRLWMALLFLILIAAVFLLSSTWEKVRPILRSTEKTPEDDGRLAGTPFEHLPDRPQRVPLSRPERLNVVFVLAVSQVVQVLTVALVTSGIFFVLGLMLLTPELLAAWTRNGSSDGQFLGMTLPVPQSLIQITMFLAALTFMYLSARVVSDTEYRVQFVDPLIDDLRLTLVARDRYRTATAERRS